MSLAPLTYRVYAADAVVRGRSPEVQLSAVLSSDGHGSLRAAACARPLGDRACPCGLAERAAAMVA